VPEKQSLGITNYLNETNNRADVALFLQTERPEAISAAQSFELISVANGTLSQTYTPEQAAAGSGIEGILDAEWVIGIGYPIPMVSWSTGGSPPFTPDLSTPTNTNEPYLVWLEYVLGQHNLPAVISTSYGKTRVESIATNIFG
jgi:tripeptidyl-peptidase-1